MLLCNLGFGIFFNFAKFIYCHSEFVMLHAIMLSVIMLKVVILSIIMLNVVMLSVVGSGESVLYVGQQAFTSIY